MATIPTKLIFARHLRTRSWISRWQAEIYRVAADRWNATRHLLAECPLHSTVLRVRVLETRDPGPLIPRRMFRAREHSSSRDSAVSYGTCEHVGAHVDTRSQLS